MLLLRTESCETLMCVDVPTPVPALHELTRDEFQTAEQQALSRVQHGNYASTRLIETRGGLTIVLRTACGCTRQLTCALHTAAAVAASVRGTRELYRGRRDGVSRVER